jgi:hypothetical protein
MMMNTKEILNLRPLFLGVTKLRIFALRLTSFYAMCFDQKKLPLVVGYYRIGAKNRTSALPHICAKILQ